MLVIAVVVSSLSAASSADATALTSIASLSSACDSYLDCSSGRASSSLAASSLFWLSASVPASPLVLLSIPVDSLEEPPPITVSSVETASPSLAMACEIGGMTSDSTRLNTEAPHKTPASTRRVALLLCLDLSEFAFIDVSSPRDRDLALSLSNVSAQSVIALAK